MNRISFITVCGNYKIQLSDEVLKRYPDIDLTTIPKHDLFSKYCIQEFMTCQPDDVFACYEVLKDTSLNECVGEKGYRTKDNLYYDEQLTVTRK